MKKTKTEAKTPRATLNPDGKSWLIHPISIMMLTNCKKDIIFPTTLTRSNMKNFLLSYLLLILVSNFVFASNIDVENNNYYTLIKDKLNEQVEQTDERERLLRILDDLVTYNKQEVIFLGCEFKLLGEDKEDINNVLKENNFFVNYGRDLKKYDLLSNKFSQLFVINRNSLSNNCNQSNHTNIIKLNNNELIVPYENLLVFYQRLSKQDEQDINNFHRYEKCLKTKQVDMDTTITCNYKNMTIMNVYNALRYYPEYIFRKKIKVGKNFSVTYDDEDMRVEVEYKWSGKNKLKITQNFDGGVTTYTFIYQGNKTKLITVYSPD
ncbi:hypothetical protein A9G11_10740 [Gilliamella sp. wkB108]|uniref:hypothetical protein n=1 Tax=Gilliamella sp. wkB108 TaxID=3120256 RepID=UPI00080E262E|nr:hypothetical protein [Gilliamella apicola]OCG28491.1 hypothetical protein A9G11_10740 [Gilliamella apicola]